MSTEQKPEPPKSLHLKEQIDSSSLGHSLLSGWEKFKAGQLIGYKWMALILIGGTAIAVLLYILSEKDKARSQLWLELEGANTLTSLEDFARAHPNTAPGRVAEMDRARFLLGPDGIDRLPVATDEAGRKKAVENIEKAREAFTGLIEQLKDDPILRLQCYLGMAKSEAALLGIPKEGAIGEYRGSFDKLQEWLDKISETADGTPWGDQAKKISSALKNNPRKREELESVQRSLYTSPLSGFPGSKPGPLAPGGGPGIPPIGSIPGTGTGARPIILPKTPDPKTTPEIKAPDPKGPKAPDPKAKPPETKTAEPKPPVKPPEPKGPKAPDAKGPKPPEAKATAPKAPEKAPAPDPKPATPPKK